MPAAERGGAPEPDQALLKAADRLAAHRGRDHPEAGPAAGSRAVGLAGRCLEPALVSGEPPGAGREPSLAPGQAHDHPEAAPAAGWQAAELAEQCLELAPVPAEPPGVGREPSLAPGQERSQAVGRLAARRALDRPEVAPMAGLAEQCLESAQAPDAAPAAGRVLASKADRRRVAHRERALPEAASTVRSRVAAPAVRDLDGLLAAARGAGRAAGRAAARPGAGWAGLAEPGAVPPGLAQAQRAGGLVAAAGLVGGRVRRRPARRPAARRAASVARGAVQAAARQVGVAARVALRLAPEAQPAAGSPAAPRALRERAAGVRPQAGAPRRARLAPPGGEAGVAVRALRPTAQEPALVSSVPAPVRPRSRHATGSGREGQYRSEASFSCAS
ncbi:hypothetical protein BIWAKO_01569 [Bosea sp. BIWAKO-01]|nr:hypothetical protein BIWAKO_01569 [Bosea sp. BIWAKO-01]